jgi:putative endonuclease
MSSPNGTLYTGVTRNIWYRVLSHKQRKLKGFSKKYGTTRLYYFEETKYILNALAREKEIKGWRRAKKISLIKSINPKCVDLAEHWYPDE